PTLETHIILNAWMLLSHCISHFPRFYYSALLRAPRSTLFPYTTLFRSGTNGNGKSTLMKCIMGMLRPTSGSIVAEIDGKQHNLIDRKSTRLNSSHVAISYAVFCLKKKNIPVNVWLSLSDNPSPRPKSTT